jgi:Flp pilus assembly pilin Flp
MLEYGLLVGLIAVVAIAGVTALGGSFNTMFSELSTTAGEVGTGQ